MRSPINSVNRSETPMGASTCSGCGKQTSGLFDHCSGKCREVDTFTWKIFIGSSGASYPDFRATTPDAIHALEAKASINRGVDLVLASKDKSGSAPKWVTHTTIER